MKKKFTIGNFLKIGEKALDFQLKELYPLQTSKDPLRIYSLFLNHDRNFSTFLTIMYLAEHKRIADIYTLSRSMFESVISMGLIAKKLISEDIERYQEFQYLEIYKTYNHLNKLGLAELSGISSSEIETVLEKRKNYIEKWGQSKLSWSGKSLEDNVKIVDSNYPVTCNEKHFYGYLYCQVYRKGSQSAHSSYAGLSKGVQIERMIKSGQATAFRFREYDEHLIFSCFHSVLVFLSSARFLGYITEKEECENYFQKVASYIISE